MTRLRLPALVLGGLLVASGCGRALIYSRTISPLTFNFDHTPRGEATGSADIKTLQYRLQIDWDRNDIGSIAREHGIGTVYFADKEELSVLGIWRRKWVHIYGAPAEGTAPDAASSTE